MTSIELLAPARNLECGLQAISHGADAVYIGAPRFGARAAAGNTVDDIATLCRHAHTFGARVYVTVNTILYDHELPQVEELLWQLHQAGADAFIVQDLALLRLHRPPVPLHASTQMDNRTPEQVRWLWNQGYTQAVLARECSLADIRRIHLQVPQMPLEAFVHGALCVSLSGRCQASQHCFGRSANRGECAQFCRLPFDLVDSQGHTLVAHRHLLSLRDMNRTAHLEEMMDAGIRSFKIEGRLKDVNYVKNVTAWYRQQIDAILVRRPEYCRASAGTVEIRFQPQPEMSFSRGFTPYFLHGRAAPMASTLTPGSTGPQVGIVKECRRTLIVVASTARFANGDGLCYFDTQGHLCGFRVNRAEGNHLYPAEPVNIPPRTALYRSLSYEWERQMAGVTAQRTMAVDWRVSDDDEGIHMEMQLEDGRTVARHFALQYQPARRPQTDEITRQLQRMGDTPYRTRRVEISLSKPWFVPASQWAQWRRTLATATLPPIASAQPRPQIADGEALPHGAAYNVSNHLASQVCQQCATPHARRAPEAGGNPAQVLMECRYCLRHELGICLRRSADAPTQPLFLRSTDGRMFPLHFDCQRCMMMVLPHE